MTAHLSARPPREADAADVWRLVDACDALDTNSPYAYLLLCTDFAESGLVLRQHPAPDAPAGTREEVDPSSEEPGELVGFVLGYVPPTRPDTYFVWQIGVAESARGRGLGRRLLDLVLERAIAKQGVAYLEATVTPSNAASRSLFTNFARDRGAGVEEVVAFRAASFPASGGDETAHEDEVRLRIGPLCEPLP